MHGTTGDGYGLNFLTCGTYHTDANGLADFMSTAKPGDRFVYAFGDLACSIDASKSEASRELRSLRELAQRYYESGAGLLTQRRRAEAPFTVARGRWSGASFEYIFTAAKR